MPELPEVETIVRSLRPLVTGRRIIEAEFCFRGSPEARRNRLRRILATPPREFVRRVEGTRIEGVERYGKNLVFDLRPNGVPDSKPDGRLYLLVHLGMTGRVTSESTPEFRDNHTHIVFRLQEPGDENGRWLHYSDIRRFGRIRLTSRLSEEFAKLGPDPLEISGEEFLRLLRTRRAMLKSLLLNQHFLRGLGNIYADESLFRAGIHPAAIASRLSRRQALRLYEGIRETLSLAIAEGGSSISDYVDAAGRPGFFQLQHQVYQRAGEPCVRCGPRFGSRIRKMIISSRSTHYCSRCQRK
jgi:formamidopyrimidine-DNA glycosylase